MALISLAEAAKLVGKSKPTLWRAHKRGMLSMERNANNEWEVETSELLRAYPPQATKQDEVVFQHATPELSALEAENKLLKQNIETLESSLKRSDVALDDLRKRLDDSETERREATRTIQLLIHQPTEEVKRPNWAFVALITTVSTVVIALVYAIKSNLVNLN